MKIRSFSCIFPPNSLLIGTERSLIDWAVSNYLLEQIGMKVFFVHFLKKENTLPKKYFLVKIHDLKFCANSSSQFVPLANRQIKVGPCHFEVLHSGSLPLCKNDAKGQVCNAWQWQVAAVSTAINSFGFIAIFLWNDFWCNVAVQGMLKKCCHFSSFFRTWAWRRHDRKDWKDSQLATLIACVLCFNGDDSNYYPNVRQWLPDW